MLSRQAWNLGWHSSFWVGFCHRGEERINHTPAITYMPKSQWVKQPLAGEGSLLFGKYIVSQSLLSNSAQKVKSQHKFQTCISPKRNFLHHINRVYCLSWWIYCCFTQWQNGRISYQLSFKTTLQTRFYLSFMISMLLQSCCALLNPDMAVLTNCTSLYTHTCINFSARKCNIWCKSRKNSSVVQIDECCPWPTERPDRLHLVNWRVSKLRTRYSENILAC